MPTRITIGRGAASTRSPRSKTTGRYLKKSSTKESMRARRLRRKSRSVEPRDDPERVLVVDLLQYLVRQVEPVHLPERVAPAVVVEVLVRRLQHAKVCVVLSRLIAVLAEEHSVLILDEKLAREARLP